MESPDGEAKASGRSGPVTIVRTSDLLGSLVAEVEGETASVGWLLARLRKRAFGYALLVFALPSCLPMPPGVPAICGVVLAIVGVQMIVGVHPLWLPSFLSRREVARTSLEALVRRASPSIERLERLARPRLSVMTGPVGYRLVGILVVVLALIMVLPIPFLGNMPPAVAIVIIAIGLTEGDGIIVSVGLIASLAALALSGTLAIEAARFVLSQLTG